MPKIKICFQILYVCRLHAIRITITVNVNKCSFSHSYAAIVIISAAAVAVVVAVVVATVAVLHLQFAAMEIFKIFKFDLLLENQDDFAICSIQLSFKDVMSPQKLFEVFQVNNNN